MTTSRGSDLLDTLFGVIRVIVALWVAWTVLIMTVVLVTERPVVGFLLAVGATVLGVYVFRSRNWSKRHRYSEYHNAKAVHYRKEHLQRAETYPDIVFEENVPLWAKELAE